MRVGKYAAMTNVGNVRKHNEDCYRVNTDLGLFAIADGMGGHASGEVASAIAVDTVESQLEQGVSLLAAIEQAHIEILKGVDAGMGKPGMGTTIVAVQLHGDDYTLAWAGDSRAYLWDEGITQISKDHSLVQMLIDSGKINRLQAREHPRRNIIYQNLGAKENRELQVSLRKGVLYRQQKLILCSDGLSDELQDEVIEEIVRNGVQQQSSEEEMVSMLVDAALDSGGNDNISVLILSAAESAPERLSGSRMKTDVNVDTLVPKG